MSFDLMVWSVPQNVRYQAAFEKYDEVTEVDRTSEGPVGDPALDGFFEELTALHPEMTDPRVEAGLRNSPWNSIIWRGPDYILMLSSWPASERVLQTVTELATRYGLALYNPQAGTVTNPPRSEPSNGFSLSVADGTIIQSPDLADIRKSFAHVSEENWYLILEGRQPKRYVQTACQRKGNTLARIVEFRDGSADRHFVASPISESDAVGVFTTFLAGGNVLELDVPWKRVHLN